MHIGNQVSFNADEGRIFGVVIKKNRKTVVVLSEDKRRWKLPPGMLTIVKDI
ncbi:transposase [Ketobacter sp. MCCC 1A13808]|nr:transposase [Ketobacter sp. MCCC 1A13808]